MGDISPFLSVTGDRNTIVTGDMDLSQNRHAHKTFLKIDRQHEPFHKIDKRHVPFLKVDKRQQGTPQGP
jgi:hypothetical protein